MKIELPDDLKLSSNFNQVKQDLLKKDQVRLLKKQEDLLKEEEENKLKLKEKKKSIDSFIEAKLFFIQFKDVLKNNGIVSHYKLMEYFKKHFPDFDYFKFYLFLISKGKIPYNVFSLFLLLMTFTWTIYFLIVAFSLFYLFIFVILLFIIFILYLLSLG